MRHLLLIFGLRIIPEIKPVVTSKPTEKQPLLNEDGFPLKDGKPMMKIDPIS